VLHVIAEFMGLIPSRLAADVFCRGSLAIERGSRDARSVDCTQEDIREWTVSRVTNCLSPPCCGGCWSAMAMAVCMLGLHVHSTMDLNPLRCLPFACCLLAACSCHFE